MHRMLFAALGVAIIGCSARADKRSDLAKVLPNEMAWSYTRWGHYGTDLHEHMHQEARGLALEILESPNLRLLYDTSGYEVLENHTLSGSGRNTSGAEIEVYILDYGDHFYIEGCGACVVPDELAEKFRRFAFKCAKSLTVPSTAPSNE